MSKRLYEDHLPIEVEYFVESAQNKVEVLREAEQVSREKLAVDVIFKNALNGLLKVTDKFEKPLDVSKGDIKRVVGNKELLATINKLTKNFEINAKDILTSPINVWGLDEFVALSRKSYLYISNLSREFAQGYTANNLIIMNYYKALVSNLFALVGECVAYTVSGDKVDYQSLRVITLKEFVEAYEKGNVQKFFDTSKKLLESMEEPTGPVLTESYDIVQSGMQFVKRFINKKLDRDGQIGDFVYKAVEFTKQLLTLKQMIWPMVVNMLPKMKDYIQLFKGFTDGLDLATNMGQTNRIADQIIANTMRADEKANYLIGIENEQMGVNIQKTWNAEQNSVSNDFSDFSF